jgi:putative Ca2+/H+ antiporter (TMEM165/GDT1 family)
MERPALYENRDSTGLKSTKLVELPLYADAKFHCMDVVPIISTFLLILVAELGDKTQLAIISLSCNHKATQVFLGAMLAFLTVDGISIAVGGPLLALLPMAMVQVVSGGVFIFFGVLPWLRKEKTEADACKPSRLPLLTSFSMVALMELGDKTQIITVTLAAENPPIMVLIGITLAFALLTGVAVLTGAKLVARLPMKWLKIGTSALFIILGSLSIIGAVFGITIL